MVSAEKGLLVVISGGEEFEDREGEINPATASFTNRFKGTVLEVIYFGDHNTVRLAMAGQEDFIAHIPASAPSSTLRSGEEVEICWSPDHCCALEPL